MKRNTVNKPSQTPHFTFCAGPVRPRGEQQTFEFSSKITFRPEIPAKQRPPTAPLHILMPVCATLALIKGSRDTLAAATNSQAALNLQMWTDVAASTLRRPSGDRKWPLALALTRPPVCQRATASLSPEKLSHLESAAVITGCQRRAARHGGVEGPRGVERNISAASASTSCPAQTLMDTCTTSPATQP